MRILRSLKIIALLTLTVCIFACNDSKDKNGSIESIDIQYVTSDIDNFWEAFDASGPDFDQDAFQKLYIDKGSEGVDGFMKDRIVSAEYLSKTVRYYSDYYSSIRENTLKIASKEDDITKSLLNLKELYPKAEFPTVYFVMGTLSSGGTSSKDGLIIGAEMYSLSDDSATDKLSNWLKTVLKPAEEVTHIVAHELVHFQQTYFDVNNLLEASIKEGSCDFIAELISGKHPNTHIHDFANPKEEELWNEFKDRMYKDDFSGWLYSEQEGRPNDLGYWMGYKISKSYYDHAEDKKQAIHDILNIKDFEQFLEQSKYAEKF